MSIISPFSIRSSCLGTGYAQRGNVVVQSIDEKAVAGCSYYVWQGSSIKHLEALDRGPRGTEAMAWHAGSTKGTGAGCEQAHRCNARRSLKVLWASAPGSEVDGSASALGAHRSVPNARTPVHTPFRAADTIPLNPRVPHPSAPAPCALPPNAYRIRLAALISFASGAPAMNATCSAAAAHSPRRWIGGSSSSGGRMEPTCALASYFLRIAVSRMKW